MLDSRNYGTTVQLTEQQKDELTAGRPSCRMLDSRNYGTTVQLTEQQKDELTAGRPSCRMLDSKKLWNYSTTN